MYHGKKVGEIFETKDLSIFKPHIDNRQIRVNHVKKLIEKMRKNGWLKTSKVIINEKNQIIDGHHRILAAIESGVAIRYEVVKGATGDDITELNTTRLLWSPFDHLEKFVKRGNQHYIYFKNLSDKFPHFKYTEIGMFCNNSLCPVQRDSFENGLFVTKSMKVAELWANNITQLRDYFPKYYNRAIFVRAMVKLLSQKPDFIFDEFMKKVKLRPNMLTPCGTVDQYVEMIVKLYNYNRREDSRIDSRF